MVNQSPPDSDWPYCPWVPISLRDWVRTQLLSPSEAALYTPDFVNGVDQHTLKSLICLPNQHNKKWLQVINRLEKKTSLPNDSFLHYLFDSPTKDNAIDVALTQCAVQIARLPSKAGSLARTPRRIAQAKLEKIAALAEQLGTEINISGHLLGHEYLTPEFFVLYKDRIQDVNVSKTDWGFASFPPGATSIENVLSILATFARREAASRDWKNPDKTQFYIDGVLIAFWGAFGFAYPAFVANIASNLVDGYQQRKGVKATMVTSEAVAFRAKKLKIPIR